MASARYVLHQAKCVANKSDVLLINSVVLSLAIGKLLEQRQLGIYSRQLVS